MSKEKMHKCPKCGERSLAQVKHNVYECITCRHRVDINDFEWGWILPAISVGSITGLIVCTLTWILLGRTLQGSALQSQGQSLSQPQELAQQQNQSKPTLKSVQPQKNIAKAVSGNQVVLQINDKSTEVFLCGVNAPAPKSPYFAPATAHLQQLLDRTGSDNLMLTAIANVDGKPIVELYDLREANSLNAQQVASGYAVSSSDLAQPCRDRDRMLSAALQAQTERKGLWAK